MICQIWRIMKAGDHLKNETNYIEEASGISVYNNAVYNGGE